MLATMARVAANSGLRLVPGIVGPFGNSLSRRRDCRYDASRMSMTGDAPPRAVSPHATEASEPALRAQPDLAEVQASIGFRKFRLDWDWPGTEAAFRRAIELDPS